MENSPIDLKARARRAMVEAGFQPDFPPAVLEEAKALRRRAAQNSDTGLRDMRALLWSSIDNDTSRDLDQIEYVEKLGDGTLRLLVGIADVDADVAKGTATD